MIHREADSSADRQLDPQTEAWLAIQQRNEFVRMATPSLQDLEDERQRRRSPRYGFDEPKLDTTALGGLMLKGGGYSLLDDSPQFEEARQMIDDAAAARRDVVRGMSADRLEEQIREAKRAEEARREQIAVEMHSQRAPGMIPTHITRTDVTLDMFGKAIETGRAYPSGHPVGIDDTGNYDPGAPLMELAREPAYELHLKNFHEIPHYSKHHDRPDELSLIYDKSWREIDREEILPSKHEQNTY